jgi:hypothetical protein
MRLTEWRAAAPHRDAATAKVAAVVDPILVAFGAGLDPHCWIVWGEEPSVRYVILVPTDAGMIHCFVRVNVPGEGPRATAKLIRWGRVAVGELSVETTNGHRLLSFQVEQQVLRGADAEADRIAGFALRVIAAIDGRPLPAVDEPAGRRGKAAGSSAVRTTSAGPSAPPRKASKPTMRTTPTTPTTPMSTRASGRGTTTGRATPKRSTGR